MPFIKTNDGTENLYKDWGKGQCSAMVGLIWCPAVRWASVDAEAQVVPATNRAGCCVERANGLPQSMVNIALIVWARQRFADIVDSQRFSRAAYSIKRSRSKI